MGDISGLTSEPEVRLTLEAEKAIRSYLLKWVIPGAVVVSVLSGVAGFFIKNVATKTAENQAFALVQNEVFKMAAQIAAAKAQVHSAAAEIGKLKKEAEQGGAVVKSFQDQISDLERKVASTSVFQASDPQIKRIAEVVVDDPRVTKRIEEAIRQAKGELMAVQAAMQKIEATLQIDYRDLEVPEPVVAT